MDNNKFRIGYDHRADEIIDIVSAKLKPFGLRIDVIEGVNDGFEEYVIVQTEVTK